MNSSLLLLNFFNLENIGIVIEKNGKYRVNSFCHYTYQPLSPAL